MKLKIGDIEFVLAPSMAASDTGIAKDIYYADLKAELDAGSFQKVFGFNCKLDDEASVKVRKHVRYAPVGRVVVLKKAKKSAHSFSGRLTPNWRVWVMDKPRRDAALLKLLAGAFPGKPVQQAGPEASKDLMSALGVAEFTVPRDKLIDPYIPVCTFSTDCTVQFRHFRARSQALELPDAAFFVSIPVTAQFTTHVIDVCNKAEYRSRGLETWNDETVLRNEIPTKAKAALKAMNDLVKATQENEIERLRKRMEKDDALAEKLSELPESD